MDPERRTWRKWIQRITLDWMESLSCLIRSMQRGRGRVRSLVLVGILACVWLGSARLRASWFGGRGRYRRGRFEMRFDERMYGDIHAPGFNVTAFHPEYWNQLHGVLAVLPAEAVLPMDTVTMFGSWTPRLKLWSEKHELDVCLYHCLFDFGRKTPTLAQRNLPSSPWISENRGARRVLLDLIRRNDPGVVVSEASWAANDGATLKCQVPNPPRTVEKSENIAIALVTVQSTCKSSPSVVSPSAAVISVDLSRHEPTKLAEEAQVAYQNYTSHGADAFLCICTMIRNDARRLREWIEYHRLIGFQHFIFYDNDSTDELYSTLRPYLENGTAHVVNWHFRPSTNTFGPQRQAFSHCLERFGARGIHDADLNGTGHIHMKLNPLHHKRTLELGISQCEWISFHDVDEYFVIEPFRNTSRATVDLRRTLVSQTCFHVDAVDGRCRFGLGRYSSAYMPRLSFGHNDHLRRPQGLTIRAFTKRYNRWTIPKSIAHRRTLPALQNIVHYFLWPPLDSNFQATPGTALSTDALDLVHGADGEIGADGLGQQKANFALFHYGIGSWPDSVDKWSKKPRNEKGLCKLNETYIAEINEEILRGRRTHWPSTQDLMAHSFFGLCDQDEFAKNETLENLNLVNGVVGIQRHFDDVEHAVNTINQNHPVKDT